MFTKMTQTEVAQGESAKIAAAQIEASPPEWRQVIASLHRSQLTGPSPAGKR